MAKPHTQAHMGRNSLVKRLAAQVGDEFKAKAILKRRGHLKNNGKLTAKGKERDAMTAEERAIDRASKRSGKPKTAYKYDPRTNQATLK